MRVTPLVSLLSLSLALGALSAEQLAACGDKKFCKDMTNCAEAYYQFNQCGYSDLDRDSDGIPCEDVCGKTLEIMRQRIVATPFTPRSAPSPSPGADDRPTTKASTGAGLAKAETSPSSLPARDENFACGEKRKCGQMSSCAEAMFHLKQCGLRRLDADGDGVPCNSLCR